MNRCTNSLGDGTGATTARDPPEGGAFTRTDVDASPSCVPRMTARHEQLDTS